MSGTYAQMWLDWVFTYNWIYHDIYIYTYIYNIYAKTLLKYPTNRQTYENY